MVEPEPVSPPHQPSSGPFEVQIVHKMMKKKGKMKVVKEEEGIPEVSVVSTEDNKKKLPRASSFKISSPDEADLKKVQKLLNENFASPAKCAFSNEYLKWAGGDDQVEVVNVSFLCVHRALRNNSSAPLSSIMIAEMKRRVKLETVTKAVYYTLAERFTPSISCHLWFLGLENRKQEATVTQGLRKMERCDVASVTKLLRAHLRQFKISAHFEENDVQH
ncbi:unnamed protein product [Eruca vesicaria subsp. sativa]|uniref:Glycylpeptide N-tetradecanoyltransferase n=1 Tax=Eruca vesicaria subsp. sativa TaxID=29727 RepID=A0ABC8KSY4_ERUVS|nr:unnamed protein product [Eruca vesicaria subsp. sativa]